MITLNFQVHSDSLKKGYQVVSLAKLYQPVLFFFIQEIKKQQIPIKWKVFHQ